MSIRAQRQVATGNDVLQDVRVTGVLLTAGADTATLTLWNAATQTGTDIIKLSAVANTTAFVDLGGGTIFDNVTIAESGTTPDWVVFYSDGR